MSEVWPSGAPPTTTASITQPGAGVGRTGGLVGWLASGSLFPVLAILAALVVAWYVAAVLLNAPFQRDLDRRAGQAPGLVEFVGETLSQPKPTMPAPHQVAVNFFENTFLRKITSSRSLVYHSWVTLSSTMLGFAFGTALGILIAVGIVHVTTLDRSLMPWIIASQTIPILAVAPMIIVVLAAVGITGLIPKALISTYLSFFPVAVGMVKGLRSPEIMHLDLMHTYNASKAQTFWKLRVPASVPFLFASMKVAVAASLVGAIVGELPTGAVAGIGSKLLAGAYYSQTIDIWSALVAGSVVAALLVTLVDLIGRVVERVMGARPA
jgi:NitT/TauT family transport system permease protein